MEKYKDHDGDSNISGYEVGEGYIDVQFKDTSLYRYAADRPGPAHVRQMIALAKSGDGLNAYINRHIQKNFSIRLR